MEQTETAFLKKQRSSRRLRHEAQIQIFKSQWGTLEDIRNHLGLRPSQICEILKVHPSAWIRWTKKGRDAPPHIYQMLEWYLELLKWRGQNLERPSMDVQKSLTTEDPDSFVPPDSERRLEQLFEKEYLKRRQFMRLWVIMLGLQFILWGSIGFWLVTAS